MRYKQLELPIGQIAMDEHYMKTGHAAYVGPNGEWVCTERDEVEGNCFASWPPATKHEMQYEKAVLSLLQSGTFQVGSMTVSYLPDDEADKLSRIVRGYN